MLHRALFGSFERFIGLLVEHYAGAFPVWLAPVQVVVLPISEHQKEYAHGVFEKLIDAGIKVELDDSDESLGKKIRKAKMQKIPYMIVIGDKEKEAGKITVEGRKEKMEAIDVSVFIEKIQKEISEMKLD
jgi:threonyl-tRNA synthetase